MQKPLEASFDQRKAIEHLEEGPETAIIIGAGMVGLSTALFLAKNSAIERIIIVDRDTLPNGPEFRKGVPQGEHTHVLSSRALKELQSVIPDFTKQLEEAGAPLLEWGTDKIEVQFPTGLLTQDHYITRTYSGSRPLFENTLSEAVRKSSKIHILDRRDVTGLNIEDNHITSVRVRGRRGAEEQRKNDVISADHVILATGMSHNWINWLAEQGYEAPKEETIDADLTYFSADFDDIKMGERLMFGCAESVQHPMAMVIAQIEGGKFRVTVFAYRYDKERGLPKTQEDFVALAAETNPRGAELLRTGKMNGEVKIYKNCQNQREHIWDLKKWPDNLYPLGDSVVRLNPRYGQGMTLAILSAQLLGKTLEKGQDAQKYRQLLKKLAANTQTIDRKSTR